MSLENIIAVIHQLWLLDREVDGAGDPWGTLWMPFCAPFVKSGSLIFLIRLVGMK